MISATSRYANSLVVTVLKNNNDVQVIVPSSAQTYTFNYIFYAFSLQDRIDTISQAFYGDPLQWWRIGDANPEITDWGNVKIGTIIRIPNV